MQMVLFLVCTIPFWTSNVIRMISWIPLLGPQRAGQPGCWSARMSSTQPVEWLLYSPILGRARLRPPVHLLHGRADLQLDDAHRPAADRGGLRRRRERLADADNVIIPLCKPGIAIGSIFVVTIVMGDFITFGVMGGEQIASAGKMIETRLDALQFPPAAANAVILLGVTMLIIAVLNRIVDIRKEL